MRALRSLIFATALPVALAVGATAPAAAQTTTTMPPVRSIPVTPAPTSTTAATSTTVRATTATTAPAAAAAQTAAPPMADTGLPADKLVPFSFLLIGLGAALTGAARRSGRARYTFS